MTRDNERRARELVEPLTAVVAGGGVRLIEMHPSYLRALIAKAIDEAEARERERCAKLVERERKFIGFDPGAHSALKRAAAEIRKPPTPTTEEG